MRHCGGTRARSWPALRVVFRPARPPARAIGPQFCGIDAPVRLSQSLAPERALLSPTAGAHLRPRVRDPPARGLLLSDDRGFLLFLLRSRRRAVLPRMSRAAHSPYPTSGRGRSRLSAAHAPGAGAMPSTRLLEEHGDAKLTDLLVTLADCPKMRSASVLDGAKRCMRSRCHNRCNGSFPRVAGEHHRP